MTGSFFARVVGIPVSMLSLGLSLAALEPPVGPLSVRSFHSFQVRDIDGNSISLQDFRGKTVLVVNTASKCGYTSQYEGLEVLYSKYKDQGLVVLGFPSNDFMGQEPGTNEQIKEFCTLNYKVSFPLFEKIAVNGKNAAPLYQWLTGKDTNPAFAGPVSWNFNKFLIGPDGLVRARYGSDVKPEAKELVTAIEASLKKTIPVNK